MEESSAYALGANGLRPFLNATTPLAVKSPILMRSRRDTCPCDHAFRISARFRRAFSASLTRALDAFPGRYIHVSPCRICSGVQRIEEATISSSTPRNGRSRSGESLSRRREIPGGRNPGADDRVLDFIEREWTPAASVLERQHRAPPGTTAGRRSRCWTSAGSASGRCCISRTAPVSVDLDRLLAIANVLPCLT